MLLFGCVGVCLCSKYFVIGFRLMFVLKILGCLISGGNCVWSQGYKVTFLKVNFSDSFIM